ncbi:hypothetical protein [Clostridium vincentii]|uniref:hypothetical protein n=1 Tax=Clostridium vincentii TaxID=52704 RepID=UPI001A9A4452|nr:hypothetical protein [Clostridium vincentii]
MESKQLLGLLILKGHKCFFYKDENGLLTGEKGNVVGTLQDFKPKDGGNNKYKISYKATTSDVDDKLLYSVIIIITYPPKQEFKLDNFKMFKEILQVVHGKDYDVTSLETSIQEHILTVQPGEIKSRGSEEVNSFNEALSFSNQKDGAVENRLTYILTYKN